MRGMGYGTTSRCDQDLASASEVSGAEPMCVLIVSKSLDEQGGIVNFVNTILRHGSDRVCYTHVPFGRSNGARGAAGIWATASSLMRLASVARSNEWDCIHVNTSLVWRSLARDGAILLLLRILGRRNALLFVHGWDMGVQQRISESVFLRVGLRALLRYPRKVIVLASAFKQTLEGWGVAGHSVFVMSTMFDGGTVALPTTSRGRTPGRTLLFMSRFIKEKGIYELLSAFERLSERHPDLRLVFAGDGPERERMIAWCRARNLDRRVDFPGYVREARKRALLEAADVFVLPTYYAEGCPVALLEAMAAGLPVVTARAGGVSDIFCHDVNGILLDEISPRSIETAVQRLLTDERYRERIGEVNRREAWSRYEAKVVTSELEAHYHHVSHDR